MYDEAQEKMKDKKAEERVFFRIVKSKKRKPKQEPIGGPRLFDVKKYAVPNGSSSNKELPPSSGSEGSETGEDQAKKDSSNESMHSADPSNQVAEIGTKPSTEATPKKALDYSLTKKLFSIVRRPSAKEKPQESPIQ